MNEKLLADNVLCCMLNVTWDIDPATSYYLPYLPLGYRVCMCVMCVCVNVVDVFASNKCNTNQVYDGEQLVE